MDIAAVILAGGKSSRMGRDKLELSLGGLTLLESAVSRFRAGFPHVYLSVADKDKYPNIDVPRVVDIIPGTGPLSGLHAAMHSLRHDFFFLAAADLPYSDPNAANRLAELCGNAEICVIRLPGGKTEPLFACYRKTLLPRCNDAIASGDFRMTSLMSVANTRFVSPSELGSLWDERIIQNINNPEDYAKIMRDT